jgi:hypothetical protein
MMPMMMMPMMMMPMMMMPSYDSGSYGHIRNYNYVEYTTFSLS